LKIWSEPYDSLRHRNPMGPAMPAPALGHHLSAPTLEPHRVILVRVAGFTFEFHSIEQLRALEEALRRAGSGAL